MKSGLAKPTILTPLRHVGTSPVLADSGADPLRRGRTSPLLHSGASPVLADGIAPAGAGDREASSGRMEYLLVVYPYGDLRDRLLDEQQHFSSEYGLQMTVRNRPHITLAVFQAGEMIEATLIRWVERICNRRSNFEIALNNYSGIPPHTPNLPGSERIPGTIYLRIQDPQPFRELMQQLEAIDDFIRSSGWPAVGMAGLCPYLSIAGGLTEQVYNKAMPDYSRKTFHGIFRVDELVLLKRAHCFDACQTVNIFRLNTSEKDKYE